MFGFNYGVLGSAANSVSWATWDGSADGTGVLFETGTNTATIFITGCLLTTDKTMVVYRYDSTIKAVIITTSGVTPSIGTAVTVLSDSSNSISVCALDTTRAVCTYVDGSGFAKSVVLSVSGTTITVNTPATVEGVQLCDDCYVVKLDTNKCVMVYAQTNGTSGLYGAFLSISTNTITVTPGVILTTTVGASVSAATLTTSTVFTAFAAGGGNGKVMVLSISGTTISAPTAESTFISSSTANITTGSLDSTHAIVAFTDAGDGNKGKNIACIISGTTITLGSVSTFETGLTTINNGRDGTGITVIDSATALLSYSTTHTYGIVFSVSGTSVINHTKVQLDSDSSTYHTTVTLDINRVMALYDDAGSSGRGTSIVLKKG